jgi:hypothetical protein
MPMLLQVLPVPPGTPQSPTDLTFAQQLAEIIAEMNAQGDTKLAETFQTFANQFHSEYPQYTAQQVLSAFLATELGASLSAGLPIAGQAVGSIPGAAAKGAENAVKNLTNPLDLLGSFNLGSWFLRIAEILLGLVLVGVGVAKLTGASNFISTAVKAKIP